MAEAKIIKHFIPVTPTHHATTLSENEVSTPVIESYMTFNLAAITPQIPSSSTFLMQQSPVANVFYETFDTRLTFYTLSDYIQRIGEYALKTRYAMALVKHVIPESIYLSHDLKLLVVDSILGNYLPTKIRNVTLPIWQE